MRVKNYIFLIAVFAGPVFSLAQEQKPSVKFSEFNLYDGLKLPELERFTTFNTRDLKGVFSVWVLFQPECSSCSAQLKNLICLPADTSTLAVGFWGTREKLKDELQFLKFKGKKLMASSEFEKRIQLRQTPTVLVVDQQGGIKYQFYALTPCEDLRKLIQK